jgi:hypothetical protein
MPESTPRHVLFVDTNTLLHFRRPDEIAWQEVLGIGLGTAVEVVVTGVVFREVDQKAHNAGTSRVRRRAGEISRRLQDWLAVDGTEIRSHVRVRAHWPVPDDAFLRAHSFNAQWSDDLLVASAVAYQAAHPDAVVALVSDDGYPRTRAGGAGLRVVALGEEWRLEGEESTEDRELRETRRELQRLQSMRPRLDVLLGTRPDDAAEMMSVTIRTLAPLTDAELREALAAEEARFVPAAVLREREEAKQRPVPSQEPPQGAREPSAKLPGVDVGRLAAEFERYRGTIGESEYRRYEDERTHYLGQYAKYLARLRDHERRQARRFTVDVLVRNTGTAPADDLTITLHVPDPLLVFDEGLGRAPQRPKPPTPPQRSLDLLARSAFDITPTPTPRVLYPPAMPDFGALARGPANVSGLEIRKANSHDVECRIKRVKQHSAESLPTMWLSFPERATVAPFAIPYRLVAASLPDPVAGALNVVARPG